jgi:hypothetical protein
LPGDERPANAPVRHRHRAPPRPAAGPTTFLIAIRGRRDGESPLSRADGQAAGDAQVPHPCRKGFAGLGASVVWTSVRLCDEC